MESMWIYTTDHHPEYQNVPINLNNIVYIDKGHDQTRQNKNGRFYAIIFYDVNNMFDKFWYFQDELIRDNRYNEILKYISATKI